MQERVELFIDGENLMTRFEAMLARGYRPRSMVDYDPGVYVASWGMVLIGGNAPVRSNYYTATIGSEDRLEEIRRTISSRRYDGNGTGHPLATLRPKVFKKERRSQKTKSVDINLTTDVLRCAHSGHVDRIVVISGDGDYIPVYEEVMRLGRRVTVGALSDGLNPLIRPRVDAFVELDSELLDSPYNNE